MPELSVNIDHVASVRNARYRPGKAQPGTTPPGTTQDDAYSGEPDPARAAHEVELGGADGVTVHLREDRRHIRDEDVEGLRRVVRVRFNLEMAATDEMVAIARRVVPHSAMLVPEGRDEVTTEGGLNVAGQLARLRGVVGALREGGMQVSAFVDPELAQVEAAGEAGFDVCEIHTGPYAHAFARAGGDFRRAELASALDAVRAAGTRAVELGMRFNAGHALNYHNVRPIAALAGVSELHIGHAVVSRAVYVGLRAATREMRDLIA